MIQIQKPTIPNTQFKPVSKPIFQETPKFEKINLLPPKPPQPIDVDKLKPQPIAGKPKPIQMEDFIPLVALGVIGLFVMYRN